MLLDHLFKLLRRPVVLHIVEMIERSLALRVTRCSVNNLRSGLRLRYSRQAGREEQGSNKKGSGATQSLVQELNWYGVRTDKASLNELRLRSLVLRPLSLLRPAARTKKVKYVPFPLPVIHPSCAYTFHS